MFTPARAEPTDATLLRIVAETVPYRGAGNTQASPPHQNDSPHQANAYEATLPSVSSDQAPHKGAKIGRYNVLERVGAGGMGVVYRAYDPELHREVAIKLLNAGRASGPRAKKQHKRLLREARAMAQLSHPNVIPVYEVGEFGDGLYVAMEFVLGSNARDWLKAVNPPWRRILGVFRAAGRGLAAAHGAGLVHRDFKPANVLVGDDGRVRVLDFGLARAVSEESQGFSDPPLPISVDENELESHWSETLTADGAILGTPIYMAPEQYTGRAADARSDQYGYCLALYEALYGHLPFRGQSVKEQALAKHQGDLIEPSSSSAVPRRLFDIVRRGLCPRPEDRFPSMPALLRELRIVQQQNQGSPSWRGPASLAGVIVITVGLTALSGLSSPKVPTVMASRACPDVREALVGTWDHTRRTELGQVLVNASLDGTQRRWLEVEAAIDAWARAWMQRYARVCASETNAASTPGHLRAQLACLDRHRIELEAVVTTLGDDPSAVVMDHAVSAIAALPSLDDCGDGLPARNEPEGLAQIEQGLAYARALRTTGQTNAAQQMLERLIPRAQTDPSGSVLGRARLELAYLHLSAGQRPAAQRELEAAYFHAVAHQRPRAAATAAIELIEVCSALGRPDEARMWSEHARAHIHALDSAASLDAKRQQALAVVGADRREPVDGVASTGSAGL